MARSSTLPSPMACDQEDAKALQFIEDMTRNAKVVQQNVLTQILTRNAQTEYLKGFELNGATDRETFKSKIPMVTYEDLRPLIRRIADGDRSPILSTDPVSEFILSSGTSGGEPKLFPSIKEEEQRRMFLCTLVMPVMNLYVKGLAKGKGLYFMFSKSETETTGGLMARSTTTSLYKSDHFKNRPYNPYYIFTSPNEAIYCTDTFQSMYTQMLCGLYERELVNRVGMVFASGLLRVIRFLQLNWQQLTHDIRTGSLNPKLTDTSIRQYMTQIVRPDTNLADSIAQECAKDNWERIIARIWPNTKYLHVIVTGAMTQYIPTLDYYSGGLPIACTTYASSECFFGINLNPMCKPSEVSYTIMPNMAYFEFLPHESNSMRLTHSKLVDLVDVKIGEEYELVITTYTGLYRYQVGDILRVTGFHNTAPQFKFIRRKNMVLGIDTDKTDETELQAAIENASQLLREFNTSVVEYTSYADTTTIPGHYVIYWELLGKDSANSPSDKVLEQCCLAMEESLNSVYRRCRVADKSIGPLEIRIVKNETFEQLMDYAISRGASMNQYKAELVSKEKIILFYLLKMNDPELKIMKMINPSQCSYIAVAKEVDIGIDSWVRLRGYPEDNSATEIKKQAGEYVVKCLLNKFELRGGSTNSGISIKNSFDVLKTNVEAMHDQVDAPMESHAIGDKMGKWQDQIHEDSKGHGQ
ncbi:hypothetical protein DH2020_023942 [Rehmannia glutinosa]|uniref:Indole-3-acetic acid-amido synthetase n=1 Tax=Rehmannia glutinosa TaxID=99300 RepID=A0ABR0WBA3_REHGL